MSFQKLQTEIIGRTEEEFMPLVRKEETPEPPRREELPQNLFMGDSSNSQFESEYNKIEFEESTAQDERDNPALLKKKFSDNSESINNETPEEEIVDNSESINNEIPMEEKSTAQDERDNPLVVEEGESTNNEIAPEEEMSHNSGSPSSSPTTTPSTNPTAGPTTTPSSKPTAGNIYGNKKSKIGPWPECVGWHDEDCISYIESEVDDTVKFAVNKPQKYTVHRIYVAVDEYNVVWNTPCRG